MRGAGCWQPERRIGARGIGRQAVLGLGLGLVVAVLTVPVRAQDPGVVPVPAAGAPGAQEPRRVPIYRFGETYTREAAATASPGVIGQARIAVRETLTVATDRPQATPESQESTWQTIYRERPAMIDPMDPRSVTEAVRLYEVVRRVPALPPPPGGVPWFEGLTLYLADRKETFPPLLVINLTPGRALRTVEFDFAAQQLDATMLYLALPSEAIVVGQSYAPAPAIGTALLGPGSRVSRLVGKLASVQPAEAKDVPGPGSQIAVFDLSITGQGLRGESAVHALVDFRFEPSKPGTDGVIVSPGCVTRLRLAEESSTTFEQDNLPLKRYLRRELVLERRVEDVGELLALPAAAPEPTMDNTWLTYIEPQGRFQFRHPQTLRDRRIVSDQPVVSLIRIDPLEQSVSQLNLVLRDQEDIANLEKMQATLREDWKRAQLRVDQEAAGMLPMAEGGTESAMRVGRIEAVLTPPGPDASGRQPVAHHFLGYTVQTGHNLGMFVEGLTSATDPTTFRDEIETIVRTIQIQPGATLPPRAAEGTGPETGTGTGPGLGPGGAEAPAGASPFGP